MKKILAIDFSTASKKDEGTGYAFRKDGQLFVGSIKAYNPKKNAWERTFDIVNAIKDIIDEFDLKDYHLAIETPIWVETESTVLRLLIVTVILSVLLTV